MKSKWVASLTTAIVVFVSSFLFFTKVYPSSDYIREIVRLEAEVATIRRDMDSRFNVMKWDLETVVNNRAHSLNESIASLRYREQEMRRELDEINKSLDTIKKNIKFNNSY